MSSPPSIHRRDEGFDEEEAGIDDLGQDGSRSHAGIALESHLGCPQEHDEVQGVAQHHLWDLEKSAFRSAIGSVTDSPLTNSQQRRDELHFKQFTEALSPWKVSITGTVIIPC